MRLPWSYGPDVLKASLYCGNVGSVMRRSADYEGKWKTPAWYY